jgi:long-chain acyl-CoA synthetase
MAGKTKSKATTKHQWLETYPENVDWGMEINPKSLPELLDAAVAEFGPKEAMDFLGRAWSYNDLGEQSDRVAKGLQAQGIGPDTRVGLLLPNCPYYPFLYFGILKTGATVVNMNPLYADHEVKYLIEDAQVDIVATVDIAMLFDKIYARLEDTQVKKVLVCSFKEALPGLKAFLFGLFKGKELAKIPNDDRVIRFNDLVNNDGKYAAPTGNLLEQVAVLQYTGGTTGVPKGASLTHSNIYSNCLQVNAWFNDLERGQQSVVAVLPFFHVFAMTGCLNWSIMNGTKIFMLPRFELKDCLKTIEKSKATIFLGVPTIYNAINNSPLAEKYDLSNLTYCISGGAALPVEVKKRFEKIATCKLVEGYGLSETSPVATVNPPHGKVKEASIGQPLPGTIIDIISIEDGKTKMPLGEKGEICISGPQVMQGYWNKPEANAEDLRGGRFHTGDIGYMDDDGFTFIVDRLKEMIIAGGYKIYPRNVEEAVYLNDKIVEVAVIGVPDEYRGQTVKACVVFKSGQSMTLEELNAGLTGHLSKIELPKQMQVYSELPKSPIGKILKKELVAEHLAATT